MNRQDYIFRIRVISTVVILVGFTLILRSLLLVLSISYDIRGTWSQIFAAVLLGLTLNLLFFFFKYLAKLGPDVTIGIRSMWLEWQMATPLNKLLIFSGLISLPGGLISIATWLSKFLSYIREI